MYAVVKKFEGAYAVCEINSKDLVSIERSYLPREARVGCPFLVGNKVAVAIDEIVKRSHAETSTPEVKTSIPSSLKSSAGAR